MCVLACVRTVAGHACGRGMCPPDMMVRASYSDQNSVCGIEHSVEHSIEHSIEYPIEPTIEYSIEPYIEHAIKHSIEQFCQAIPSSHAIEAIIEALQ